MNNEKTFTQEEVNKIVQDRLAQERKKYELNGNQAQLLQEALKRAETAEKAMEEYKKVANDNKIKGVLVSALTEGKCIQPDMVFKLLKDNIQITDNGETVFVDENGKNSSVKDAVNNWLMENSWAVKVNGTPGGGSNIGMVGNTNTAELRKAFGLSSEN